MGPVVLIFRASFKNSRIFYFFFKNTVFLKIFEKYCAILQKYLVTLQKYWDTQSIHPGYLEKLNRIFRLT